MKTVLEKYGSKFVGLWHFTDKANIDSIKEYGGIFSLYELNKREIIVSHPGGNQWSQDADRRAHLHDFVHLAFISDHPMQWKAKSEGRHPTSVWLKISPDILLNPGIKYTNEVSNKAGAKLMDAAEAVDGIDHEVLFARLDWKVPEIYARRQAAKKSEILVPKFIPINMILDGKYG